MKHEPSRFDIHIIEKEIYISCVVLSQPTNALNVIGPLSERHYLAGGVLRSFALAYILMFLSYAGDSLYVSGQLEQLSKVFTIFRQCIYLAILFIVVSDSEKLCLYHSYWLPQTCFSS